MKLFGVFENNIPLLFKGETASISRKNSDLRTIKIQKSTGQPLIFQIEGLDLQILNIILVSV